MGMHMHRISFRSIQIQIETKEMLEMHSAKRNTITFIARRLMPPPWHQILRQITASLIRLEFRILALGSWPICWGWNSPVSSHPLHISLDMNGGRE